MELTDHDLRVPIELAAADGDIETLKRLSKIRDPKYFDTAIEIALQHGQYETTKFLYSLGFTCGIRHLDIEFRRQYYHETPIA